MKALLITSKPSYPTIDGGCYATARFIDCLQFAKIDFDIFTLSTEKHPFTEEAYPTFVLDHSKVYHSKIRTSVTPVGAVKSLFSSDSYNVKRFDDEATHESLKDVLSNNYSHVIFDSLFSAPYLKTVKNFGPIKTFIRTHNVEHIIWELNSENESKPIQRAFKKNLSKKLKIYENEILNDFDGIFSISDNDTQEFEQLGIQTKIHDIPVSIAVAQGKPDLKNLKAFHLGSMNWSPNVEAVEKLIDLWNSVKKEIPNAELHIAGSGMENWKPKRQDGVIVDGFVEKVNNYAQQNGVLISPIISGSGVKIKILEMLALGVPVITTTKGAEGLKKNNMLMVADGNTEMLKSILLTLNNTETKEKLSQAGKAYIAKYHDISDISKKILAALNE